MDSSTALREQAVEALRQSPIPALRGLRVEQASGTIVISGKVTSYYYKQLAQETVLPLMAGRGLSNQVTVVANGQPASLG